MSWSKDCDLPSSLHIKTDIKTKEQKNRNIRRWCLNVCRMYRCPIKEWGGQREDGSCHTSPLTDFPQLPCVYVTNWKEARHMHPHVPASICRALFSLLAFAGRTLAPEDTRHPSFTSAPQSTGGPALISSLNILTLSQVHHKFTRATLSTWSFWREHCYICTWKSIRSIFFHELY